MTLANGNPIKEKEKMNNPSPNVQKVQPKEKPLTEPDGGGRKPTGKKARKLVLDSNQTTDLTTIAKEKQNQARKEK